MIELRPYQVKAAEALREACKRHREVLLVLPTGAGKSKQAAAMARAAAAKGRRVILGVPKVELVRQAFAALAEERVSAGLIAAGAPEMPDLPVQIASIATLTRPQRLEPWAAWRPDLLLIDECHHVLAPSWRRIIDTLPYARLIGFTATPLRLDGKGLGRIFSEMITATTVKELIAGGWLSPVKTFAPPLLPDLSGVTVRRGDYVADELAQRMNQQRLVGDCVEHYRRHCNGGAALGYACTIAHSKALVEAFRAAGYRAVHVDADTKANERETAVAALGAGDIDIIFNVGLFTEGLDLPALAGVLMARPTKSRGLYLQMAGRAMRAAPGKELALILDHAGNCLRHGLPEWNQEWSLADRRKSRKGAPVRTCPVCGLVIPLGLRVCPHCGEELRAAPEAPPAAAPGELIPPDADELEWYRVKAMPRWEQKRWAGVDLRRLALVAAILGFKPGWAWHEQRRAFERRGERV